jgi:AraC-like DNA-binding protein
VYLEDAFEEWHVDYDMLELCVSQRFSASQIYFKGGSQQIGGQLGELICLPRRRRFDFHWRTGQEINLCVYFLDKPLFSCDTYTETTIAPLLSIGSPKVYGLMRQLSKEIARPGRYSCLIIEGLCLQLEGALAQHIETLPTNRIGEASTPSAKLLAMLEFVDGRRGTPALSELSKRFGCSRRHFARVFTEVTGTTYSRYLSAKRIRVAKDLITQTRKPMKEIAFELGFQDSHSFSRAFRSAVGRCPTEYRSDFE